MLTEFFPSRGSIRLFFPISKAEWHKLGTDGTWRSRSNGNSVAFTPISSLSHRGVSPGEVQKGKTGREASLQTGTDGVHLIFGGEFSSSENL